MSERFAPARYPGCGDGADLIFNEVAAGAFEGLAKFADLAARAIQALRQFAVFNSIKVGIRQSFEIFVEPCSPQRFGADAYRVVF